MKKKIPIGTIVRAFGIKGEVKVALLTDIPQQRFKQKQALEVFVGNREYPVAVESFRMHQEHALIKFEGFNSIDDVSVLVQGQIKIEIDPESETRTTLFDCLGCQVVEADTIIGMVVDVLDMPAHPILKVDTKEKTIMIPLVDAFVLDIDKKNRIISIQSIDGLL